MSNPRYRVDGQEGLHFRIVFMALTRLLNGRWETGKKDPSIAPGWLPPGAQKRWLGWQRVEKFAWQMWCQKVTRCKSSAICYLSPSHAQFLDISRMPKTCGLLLPFARPKGSAAMSLKKSQRHAGAGRTGGLMAEFSQSWKKWKVYNGNLGCVGSPGLSKAWLLQVAKDEIKASNAARFKRLQGFLFQHSQFLTCLSSWYSQSKKGK